jgi:hypothetical protein
MENQSKKQYEAYKGTVFTKILQPAFFTILLVAGIYSGIKIGQPAIKMDSESYASQEVIPYLNEMEGETIEAFLMDRP